MHPHQLTHLLKQNSPMALPTSFDAKLTNSQRQQRLTSWPQALLLLSLSACIWPMFASAADAQFARLYRVNGGAVYLKRPNWRTFYRTYPRTMLTGDDLLNVEANAEAFLLCPNGTLSDAVEAGVSNVSATCNGTPRSVRPSYGISDEWAATDANTPYIISPWSEQVLTDKPPLRWNAVAGAQQYAVTLQQRVGETWVMVWTVMSDQALMNYPADQPPLEPGEEYALQVAAISKTDLGEAGLGEVIAPETAHLEETPSIVFRLLDGFNQQSLTEDIAEVEAFDVDPTTKRLILIEEVYPRYKLFAEGINELTALVEAGTESEQIYRLLGDYYIRSGLALPAESSYLKALALAQASENIEEQALAAWGLGTLYGRTDQTVPACAYLQQAKKLAGEIGDLDLASDIEAELARLSASEADGERAD